MLNDPTRPTALTPEEQAWSQPTRVHFHSVPYHRATALERASKRGAFTLTLEDARTLVPCSVTVLRDVPLMMWTDGQHSSYLLMVGRFGEMALKVYLTPPLMANLYRATRPRRGFLELLSVSLEEGRTTLTLKRGDGPAFPYTLEHNEALQVGFRENQVGIQVDTMSSGGKVCRRVLRATSQVEAVLEQVWTYQGYSPNPIKH